MILTRKTHERICIQLGDQIVWLEVVRIEDNKVRLGFEAPRSIQIDRAEVLRSKQQRESERDR